MNVAPQHTDNQTPSHPLESPEARTARQLAALREFSDITLALSRKLGAQAMETEDAELAADLSVTLTRVGRAMRQTFALESRIAVDEHRRRDKIETEQAALAAKAQAARDEVQRRARFQLLIRKSDVLAGVEYAANKRVPKEDRENLLAELEENLVDADEDECKALMERPIHESVMMICKDLGLEVEPALFKNQYWAKQEGFGQDPPDDDDDDEPDPEDDDLGEAYRPLWQPPSPEDLRTMFAAPKPGKRRSG